MSDHKSGNIITFKVKPLTTFGNSIVGIIAGTFFLIVTVNLFLTISPSESLFLFVLSAFLMTFTVIFLLLLVLGYEGVDVDIERGLWRGYTGFLGLKSGKYEPVPHDLNYVLVFEGDFAYYETGYSQVTADQLVSLEFDFYEVSVVYDNARKQVFLMSENKQKVIEVADKLGVLFNLAIHANLKE